MNARNIVWLGVIVAVGVVGVVAFGLAWGLIAAGVTLVVSETAERLVRKRRRAARGESAPVSFTDAIVSRRKPR